MSNRYVIVGTGDSTTYSSNPSSWFYQAQSAPVAPNVIYYGIAAPRSALKLYPDTNRLAMNIAYSGWKLAQLELQATGLSGYFSRNGLINADYNDSGGRPTIHNILSVRIGTNHDEPSAATYAALLRTYYLAAQAAGWLVIDCPRWSRTGEDAFMQGVNAITATWGTSDGVAAVVPGTNPLLYGTGASLNTTYFSDGVHPTALGHSIAASEYLTVQEALITSLGG
jgi:hypothetical protein